MKKMTGLFFAATVLVGMGGTIAQAAENTAVQVGTDTKVTFEKNEEPTNPTDPENPGEEVDPENPTDPGEGGEGGEGDLRIDWAPGFNFGAHTIKTTEGLNFPVVRTATQTTAHFVQVTDNRAIANGNWKLNVDSSALTSGENMIDGANISFVGQTAKMQDDQGNIVEVPGGPAWGSQVITFGTDQTLLSAAGDGAMGTSSMGMSTKANVNPDDLTDSNINLNIPSASAKKIKKGEYSATLTWNLTSDVAAEGTFMAPKTK